MVKYSLFSKKKSLNIRGKLIELEMPKIMGVLNITPDSFYSESRVVAVPKLLYKVEKMIQEGMDILDIGGFSTRPNAQEVSEKIELKRVLPFIELLVATFPNMIISIDTFRASVARKAIEAGASIINDVSGGQADKEMFKTVTQLRVPYILMHMRGSPTTMMSNLKYKNIIKEVSDFFIKKTFKLRKMGHNDIIIDPGFGFSKNINQNYELLKHLNYLNKVGYPVAIGVSRKSMIYKLFNTTPEESLNGTSILNFVALEKGVKILRVHDVKETRETVKLFTMLKN